MSEPLVRSEVRGTTALLTLNRPESLNAWSAEMAHALAGCLAQADADDAVRAVVVTGAGRAFCAGAALQPGGETFSPGQRARASAGGSAHPYPFEIHKPVIAAINGHAIGVGITYPMTCDLRFVAEDAKVQFAFVRRGVLPELGSHVIVSRVAGLSHAADLLLTGRIISGRELAQRGLASAAMPAEQVLEAALDRAREFEKAAPVSVAISKQLLWESLGVHEMMERENRLFAWTGAQPDAREGVQSFLEKRAPRWSLRPSRDLPQLAE